MMPVISTERVRVWDAPTRAFHWLFAAAFAAAFLTGDSDQYRDVHVFAGYRLLGLIVFRLAWGFAGSRYARFNSFRFPLREAAGYARAILLARQARRRHLRRRGDALAARLRRSGHARA